MRALELGKLNERGYITESQLQETIETNVPAWGNHKTSEESKPSGTSNVVYNTEASIPYVCQCTLDKHVDVYGGYVYAWRGLWKHVESVTSDHLSIGHVQGTSDTVILEDYSQTIYLFLSYQLTHQWSRICHNLWWRLWIDLIFVYDTKFKIKGGKHDSLPL